jgi:hypothetical protein
MLKRKNKDWLKKAIKLWRKAGKDKKYNIFCLWQNCILYTDRKRRKDLIKPDEVCIK